MWGDFGWNTFRSEMDNSSDLIVVKSDQFLVNWLYGKAGNNPSGKKRDVIDVLDDSDKILLVWPLSFLVLRPMLVPIGTGTNFTTTQLSQITSGDASEAAMNNAIRFYGNW